MILFLFLIKQTAYFHRSLYFARNLMQFKGFEEHVAITSIKIGNVSYLYSKTVIDFKSHVVSLFRYLCRLAMAACG